MLPLFETAGPDTSGAWQVSRVEDTAEALAVLADELAIDAILLEATSTPVDASSVATMAERAALIVVSREPKPEAAAAHGLDWLRSAAQDVMSPEEVVTFSGQRRLRFAIERKRCSDASGAAYSTDPGTGLPHRQQLVEHLSQMLALREREPSPMALLVLRIHEAGSACDDGLTADRQALRRKIAVRLRAGVRASDVVAMVDADSFAVLLGSILAAADAERVAEKLCTALTLPFNLAGRDIAIGVAAGIAHYPQDGKEPERLLRRGVALAAVAPAVVRADAATSRQAANDD